MSKYDSEKVVKDIRRRTRRKYSAEEKIRVVLAILFIAHCRQYAYRLSDLYNGDDSSSDNSISQVCLVQYRWKRQLKPPF